MKFTPEGMARSTESVGNGLHTTKSSRDLEKLCDSRTIQITYRYNADVESIERLFLNSGQSRVELACTCSERLNWSCQDKRLG